MVIDNSRYKKSIIYAGHEEYPILVDKQTERVVQAFVRGHWIDTKYYTIWQEYYDDQKELRDDKSKQKEEKPRFR